VLNWKMALKVMLCAIIIANWLQKGFAKELLNATRNPKTRFGILYLNIRRHGTALNGILLTALQHIT